MSSSISKNSCNTEFKKGGLLSSSSTPKRSATLRNKLLSNLTTSNTMGILSFWIGIRNNIFSMWEILSTIFHKVTQYIGKISVFRCDMHAQFFICFFPLEKRGSCVFFIGLIWLTCVFFLFRMGESNFAGVHPDSFNGNLLYVHNPCYRLRLVVLLFF